MSLRVFRVFRGKVLFLTAAVALAACNGGAPTEPVLSIAAQGSVPATTAGSAVGDSIRVKVVDAGGTPKAGITVSFAVTAGGGRFRLDEVLPGEYAVSAVSPDWAPPD